MANTFTRIASFSTNSGTSGAFSFNSIPQTYTDLMVVMSLRDTNALNAALAGSIYFNAQTTSYSNTVLRNNGGANSFRSGLMGGGYSYMNGGSTTAGVFTTVTHYITNYTLNGVFKQIMTETSPEGQAAFDSHTIINSSLAQISVPITSLTFSYGGSAFAQYSTATLYGIKNTA